MLQFIKPKYFHHQCTLSSSQGDKLQQIIHLFLQNDGPRFPGWEMFPYNYNSIMHYYASSGGKGVMQAIKPITIRIGMFNKLTEVRHIIHQIGLFQNLK